MCGVTLLVRIIYGEKGLISHNLTLTKFTMAPRHKYRCNFCGKGDIPTMGGLKVHISLTQACRAAMNQQMERSASPELMVSQPSVPDTLQPGFVDSEPTNSGLTGDVDLPPFIPSPRRGRSAEPESIESERQSKRARVEEVEDEEAYPRYAQNFPTSLELFGMGETLFEVIREDQQNKGQSPWAPFADQEDWELARWLARNATQTATQEFLKMKGVCSGMFDRLYYPADIRNQLQIRERFAPSYQSNYLLLKKIDQLHTGASWSCKMMRTEGDLLDENGQPLIEENELWIRDPIECIRELIGNPAFREHISYSCQKVFADKEGKNRIFDEMWTGDWWWRTQVRSPKWNKANLTYLLDPAKTPRWCGRGASYSCIR